jgi:hypothetical protein
VSPCMRLHFLIHAPTFFKVICDQVSGVMYFTQGYKLSKAWNIVMQMNHC